MDSAQIKVMPGSFFLCHGPKDPATGGCLRSCFVAPCQYAPVCASCQGDGGWDELVDEGSAEVVHVACSACDGTGRIG